MSSKELRRKSPILLARLRRAASPIHSVMDNYQALATRTNQSKCPGDQSDRIATLLGLASAAGAILDVYKRYLRDSINGPAQTISLGEELGDLLWYIAAAASLNGLKISEIAHRNLIRIAPLSENLKLSPFELPRINEENVRQKNSLVKFHQYQLLAAATSRLNLKGPEGPIAPMFGLASAVGTVLHFGAKHYPTLALSKHKAHFIKELGDILWYLAAVATAAGLSLDDVAKNNIKRIRDLYISNNRNFKKQIDHLPNLERGYLPTEKFPRHMVFYFEEDKSNPPEAKAVIISAHPYLFKKGAQIKKKNGKDEIYGFSIGAHLGNLVTDNSRRPDGYRYHDAIHIAFMAILGWSPTTRKLLGLKRRSKANTDRDEDGARAQFTEEGLSAILSRLAQKRLNFAGENNIDGAVIDIAKATVADTEIAAFPGWLWRRAIHRGFSAMEELKANKGGYLIADLDARTLNYSKTRPVDECLRWKNRVG